MPAPPITPERVTPSTVLHVLGDWHHASGALYLSLARKIEEALERGDLPPGALLPSERVLAARLAVSRGTVVAAYDELRARGIVERRRGSGTRLVGAPAQGPVTGDLAAGVRARRLTARTFRRDGPVIDLGVSFLADCTGLPPAVFNVDLPRLTMLADGHGYHPAGLPALRRRLAELHTAAGVPTSAAQIVVTVGAQQAIALTARLLIKPGDVAVVESPTYPGAIDAYSRAGARFETVPTDSGGARPEQLAKTIEHSDAQLAYLIPTAHNPTGTVLPESRRAQIAAISDATDTWIVEDESLAPLLFDERPPLPIAAHSHHDKVLTIGSMSKVLWGGLRVGWIRAPEPVAARITRLKAADDLGNCAVSQLIALDLIDQLPTILSQRHAMLRDRARLLSDALRRSLPDWRFTDPRGGLSLWVQLPSGTGDQFCTTALDFGVAVLPGSAASADEAHLDRLRLSYAEQPQRLEAAASRLADAWAAHIAAKPADPASMATG